MFQRGEGGGKGPWGAGFRLGGPRKGRLPSLWQGPSGCDTARERACESPEEVGWPSVCLDCLAYPESWESRSGLENRGAGRLGKVCKAESGLVSEDLRLGQKGPARHQGLLLRADTS